MTLNVAFNKETYFSEYKILGPLTVSGSVFTDFNGFHLLMEWELGRRFIEEM